MEIRFARQFKKLYKKSPLNIQKSFDQRLALFISNPNSAVLRNHPLQGNLAGNFTINITGDWRAVYTVAESVIIFIAIGTHSQLYG